MAKVVEAAKEFADRAVADAYGWSWDWGTREYTSKRGVSTEGGACPECQTAVADYYPTGTGCSCSRTLWRKAHAEFMAENMATHVAERWEEISTIPPRYRDARLENFAARPGTESAVTLCRGWSDSFEEGAGVGLLLIGPFGSGKTHLAVAAAYAAMLQGAGDPRFCSASTLAHDVKKGKDLDMSPVNQACSTPLLILDDIGQTGRTEFDREIIYRIISERYEAKRPVIATSNLTAAKLSEALGGALVSRLYEMTEMAALTASDYRKEVRRAS